MSAQHTPGPWEVWPYGDPRVVNSEIGWTIYTIEDPAPADLPTHLANARLIAAAPDMKEALTWALAELEGRASYSEPGQRDRCLERVRAALAKSEAL